MTDRNVVSQKQTTRINQTTDFFLFSVSGVLCDWRTPSRSTIEREKANKIQKAEVEKFG